MLETKNGKALASVFKNDLGVKQIRSVVISLFISMLERMQWGVIGIMGLMSLF